MGVKSGDAELVARVAGAYFEGLDAAAIAQQARLARTAVEAEIEALEAALILAAHELPEVLLPRAARLSAEKAAACLGEIRSRLGSLEQIRAFIAAHPAVIAPKPPASTRSAPQPDEDAAPSEDAEQALAVLDFWASKWL